MDDKTRDFEAMMRAQGPKIYTLALRLAGRESDAHDIAQEAFIKAYEHWGQFRGEAEISTWLYRICINCWKNRVRYERRRSFWKHFSLDRSGSEDDEDSVPREIAANEAPLDASMETSDRQQQVRTALAALEPQDRAILVMRDMEDRPYEEIAELLDVPLGTVKSRLARSREKLKNRLKNYV